MNPSRATDTFVICYTKPSDFWAAFSVKTRQGGTGATPRKALANAISAVDQAQKSPIPHSVPYVSNASYDLMLTLAKIAQPLTDGECIPGVVYKHERI